MPCTTLFDRQDQSYRDSVLPPAVTARVSIEAATTYGWERYVGPRGVAIGVDRYGWSAPAGDAMKAAGITPEAAADAVRKLVK
jgi:transketolase